MYNKKKENIFLHEILSSNVNAYIFIVSHGTITIKMQGHS